jgi:hypothetical protein
MVVYSITGNAQNGVTGDLSRFEVGERCSGITARTAHESDRAARGGASEDGDPVRGTDPRVGGPVPVVQRQPRINLPQQRFQAVHDVAMPRNKSRAGMHVDAVRVGILMDLLLHIPVRDVAGGISAFMPGVIPIHECRHRIVKCPDGVDEQRAFFVRDSRDVSADSVSQHNFPSKSS